MGVVTKLQNIRAEDVEKNQSQVWLVTYRHPPRLIQLSTAQNVLATMRYVDAMLKLCGYLEGISQLRTPQHMGGSELGNALVIWRNNVKWYRLDVRICIELLCEIINDGVI